MRLSYNGDLKLCILDSYFLYLRNKHRAKSLVKEAERFVENNDKVALWQTLWARRKRNIPTDNDYYESEVDKSTYWYFTNLVLLNDNRDFHKYEFQGKLNNLTPAERVVTMKAAQTLFFDKE